jgi:N,N'-diacetyllegionaminate synthase
MEILKENDVALFHCVSNYPMEPKDANLKLMEWLRKYSDVVGYSDHEDGITAAPVAVGAGAQILEKHYTLDRLEEGFDHKMSLSPEMLKEWVCVVRAAEKMLGSMEERKEILACEDPIKQVKTRTVVATEDMESGTVITREMLTTKMPNLGLPAKEIEHILGKKIKNHIAADTHITKEDIEW